MQPRQRDRIPPVRLDPLARPFRDQSRSDHHAFVAERLDLAIKPVSRRPGFKADMQPVVSVRQSLDRPLDRQRAVLDVAEKPDFARPAPFRDRDRVLPLGDIESHKDFAILSHGPPSVHEARLGMPEQPSFLPARKGGPPAQPANMTSSRLTNNAGSFPPMPDLDGSTRLIGLSSASAAAKARATASRSTMSSA